jgi:microcystin-dependent protein
VPATGRLYPQSQNLALFSLIFYEFGGSERLSAFGIPDVPEPVPGVRGNLCYAGTFPELNR